MDLSRACQRRLMAAAGRRKPRGGGGLSPTARALKRLLAAPGADVFYDGDYLAGITKDGSEKVSALMSRIGVHTVEQATAGNQPVWGATSPTGRRGVTFTAASNHRLIDPLTTIGGLYDGSQAYSALWVVKLASAATLQCVWSIGDSGSSTNVIQERVGASGEDSRVRIADADSSAAGAHSTTIVCATTLYTGAAYSSWINGTLAINASANVVAPTCDQLAIGTRRNAGAYGLPFGGEFYCLILSRTQWTASERQALEAAAKLYWGTP